MTHDALFAELRSILQRPASTETWDALCVHLDLWGVEALEAVAIPYALGIVSRWPDEVERRAPDGWCRALWCGRAPGVFVLARALVWRWGDLYATEMLSLRTPLLRRLATLDLDGADLGDHGAELVAASPHLVGLRHLNMSSNKLGAEGAQALVHSPHLTGLTSLELARNRLPATSAQVFADAALTSGLTRLDLGVNWLGDQGAATLAASPRLATLSHLRLAHNAITDAGAHALAASPHLARLLTLDLSHNKITDAGAAALAASPHLNEASRAQWRNAAAG